MFVAAVALCVYAIKSHSNTYSYHLLKHRFKSSEKKKEFKEIIKKKKRIYTLRLLTHLGVCGYFFFFSIRGKIKCIGIRRDPTFLVRNDDSVFTRDVRRPTRKRQRNSKSTLARPGLKYICVFVWIVQTQFLVYIYIQSSGTPTFVHTYSYHNTFPLFYRFFFFFFPSIFQYNDLQVYPCIQIFILIF